MPGATERIAEKLAKRNAQKAAPVKSAPVAEAPEDDEEEDQEEEPASVIDDEDDDLETIDEDEDEDEEEEAPAPPARRQGTLAQRKAAAKPAPAAKAKKAPSPAQLAARERFAAASKARAAAKAAEREDEDVDPISKGIRAAKPGRPAKVNLATGKVTTAKEKTPVQTQAEIRAKQAADRKAAQEARANGGGRVRSTPTSKPTTVKAASKPAPAAKAKAAPKAKAAKEPASNPRGETKAQVRALFDKGMSRREIMDELDMSYAAVFYHTKGLAGNVGVRGKVFVETNLDPDGKKLNRGKTEEVSRSEAMRRDYLAGMAVGDIARKYEVRYQLAYTAIRPLLGNDED